MKKILNLKTTFLIIFLSLVYAADAAVSTAIAENQKLIVSSENEKLNASVALEKRTFQVNDKIKYRLVEDKNNRKGEIIGFEKNQLLIQTENGQIINVHQNQIETLQKQSKATKQLEKYKKFLAVYGLSVGISGVAAVISLFKSENLLNPELGNFAIIATIFMVLVLLLPIIALIDYFLKKKVKKNSPIFNFKKGWKMEIG